MRSVVMAAQCRFAKLLFVLCVFLGGLQESTVAKTALAGPLARGEENPRYFVDANGEPVYLTGSHTWNSLVDMDDRLPPRSFDFAAYLDFLQAHNHNFIRLWAWEVPHPSSDRYSRRAYAAPMPWARTGPGTDAIGQPRFNLEMPNEEYYGRLRNRVAIAAERGIWVSVMLFEGWAVQFAPGRHTHPFHEDNNVNGVHYADEPTTIHTLKHSEITRLQEAHVRRVVDAVNEFDNVLYEIVNESGGYSTAWQRHMIRYLQEYQAGKVRQHPVGMTYQYAGGLTETLFASGTDWVSPGADQGRYRDEPAPADGRAVIVTDTDHLGGSAFGDRQWVWKSFMRGLNPIFMDRYEPPDSVTDEPYAAARDTRIALGMTRLLARRLDLESLVPDDKIASSGFALVSDRQLVIYQPVLRPMYLDLRDLEGDYESVWINPRTGETVAGQSTSAGAMHRLIRPAFYETDIVLVLSLSSEAPLLDWQRFQAEAGRIIDAAFELSPPATLRARIARLASNLPSQIDRAGYRYTAVVLIAGIFAGAATVLSFAFIKRRIRSRRGDKRLSQGQREI